MRCVTHLAIAFFLAGGFTNAQQTIVVSGSPTAYADALALASPCGDTLVVRAGIYNGVLTDKGVTVRCDPGAVFTGSLGARDLPVEHTFVLRGARPFEFFTGYRAERCAGAVVFDDCLNSSSPCAVVGAASVAFRRCALGPGLDVVDSTVSLSECTVRGRCFSAGGGPDCCAICVVRSDVAIAGGSVLGSPGFPPLFPPGPAIWFDRGRLSIGGGSATVVEGGSAGGSAAPAIVTTAGGAIRLDPDVQLRAMTPQAITGGATVVRAPIPSTFADPNPALQSVRVTTRAPASTPVVVLADAPRAPAFAPPLGTLWFGSAAVVVDVGVVAASGRRLLDVSVAALPPGAPVGLQPILLTVVGGRPALTAGVPVAVTVN